jgi:hypothetical protein
MAGRRRWVAIAAVALAARVEVARAAPDGGVAAPAAQSSVPDAPLPVLPPRAGGGSKENGAAFIPALPPTPYCSGEYADDLVALSPRAREFEARQQPFTYCIRTTAVYECPSYASDGSLRRTKKRVVAHGTGFGYRQPSAGETLIVTNEHVAEWPAVTDDEHPVEEVPPGCKRVSDSLRIVENESDA